MRFKIKILVFLLISVNKLFGQNFNNYNTEINNCIRKADSCKVKLDYTNSFNYLSKALNQAKKTKNINAEVYCNIKLIELFRHASIFKKSEFYLTKTETLISKNKDKITDFNLMSFYSRKAALYSEYYNIADSVNYYSTKTLTLAKKLQNLDFQFISLMEIGFYYEQTNSLGNAIAYYEKGLQVAKQHNKTSEYCDALINLARTLEKTKYYNLAIDKCNEGLKILETSDNYFQKLLFYEIKQKAYLNLGNKSAAYDNLKQRLKYTDKYYENSIQIKLIEESKKYDLLERDKTISQKEKDIKTAKQIEILLLLILTLFMVGIITMWKYSKKLKTINNKLKVYSEENIFLLNEANHRINNNLQIIIILLTEELDKIDESNQESLSIKNVLTKIESVATLHKHLYQNTDKKMVNIKNYLNEILNNFKELFLEKEIAVNRKFCNYELPIDLAMYLGLLCTELLINSIKYAFKNQKNKLISIELNVNQSILHIKYSDNGQESIGKTIDPVLVTSICQQINANYKIETVSGFELYITKQLTTNE